MKNLDFHSISVKCYTEHNAVSTVPYHKLYFLFCTTNIYLEVCTAYGQNKYLRRTLGSLFMLSCNLVFSHWWYNYVASNNLPLSNIRIASANIGTSSRLTTNPGVSLHVIVVFPRAFPHAVTFSYVSSEVSGIRITFMINLHNLLLQKCFP